MDVLLVNSNIKYVSQYASISPPLGLAYIGAVLLDAGYKVSAIDLNLTTFDADQIKQRIQETSPAIIGISACTPSFNNALKIARLAKEVNTDIKVVIGGAHSSVLYAEVAAENDIDVVVIGYGEHALLEITDIYLKGKGELGDIKGIAYKENGEIRLTERRPLPDDIDSIPFPARELLNKKAYQKPNTIIASRGGCPFACRFCSVNKIHGAIRYLRKPGMVIQEIESIIDPPEIDNADRTVVFYDDTFTLDREWVLGFCRLMRKAFNNPVQWGCMTRVDIVDSDLIGEMQKAGCHQIQYGIEAGSQTILDSIGKKITLNQIKETVRETIDVGVEAVCFFMFPFPEDTEQTVREQIHFMKELFEMGAIISLAITNPDPGTYFYENIDELGIELLSDNWDDYDSNHFIMATKNLSEEKLYFLFEELCRQVPLYCKHQGK